MQTNDKPGDFGRRLREVRERRGWTIAQLAERVGMLESSLAQIERGLTKRPAAKNRERLERWMTDEKALDGDPEISLLPARMLEIERRVAALEAAVTKHDHLIGDIGRLCNKILETFGNLGKERGAA